MGDIKVRELSKLNKEERIDSSENDFVSINPFPDRIPNVVNVKIEEYLELDAAIEGKVKVEPKDDVDMDDNKIFPINETQEEKFMSVLQLIKRTIKIQQCMCKDCGTICDSKVDLNLHHSQYHRNSAVNNFNPPTPSLIGCFRCPKRFSTYRLRHHHMFIHRNISPFVCRYCNKFFTTVKKADYHSRCAHIRFGTTPMFVCRYRCFHQVKPYERHLHVHKNRFKCTICFRRFHHTNQLDDHLIEMHSNVIEKKPKDSDSISVKSDNISECLTVKSEQNSPSIKEEPKCLDSTVFSTLLQCELCTSSFLCKDSFLLHMESHTNCLKRFNCLHCRWLYYSSQHKLDRHTKKYHPDIGKLECDEESNKERLDKENIENSSKEVNEIAKKPSKTDDKSNNPRKEPANLQTVDPQSDLMVDEVGDVDMAGFEELIKQFLN